MAASVHCSMGGTDQIEFYILNERISPSSLLSYLGWYFSNFPILEQLKWFMIYLSRLSQHQSTDLGHEMFVSPGGRTAGPLQRMSCRQPPRAECCGQLRAVRYPHHTGGACVRSPQSGARARQRRSCVDMVTCELGQLCHTFVMSILTKLMQKGSSRGLSVLMNIYCNSEWG